MAATIHIADRAVLPFSLLLFCFSGVVSAQLSLSYYERSCPSALIAIRTVVEAAVAQELRMGASLLRLHFHDCFVDGCDASVLLDDTPTFTGEKNAMPNKNSLRGFDVVDNIKFLLENTCPGTVSCADILAIAARDSVVALGGPWWAVPLGRRDSRTANMSGADTDLPSPFSDLSRLKTSFSNKGLSTTDMVALSGGHTIGKARCVSFRSRIYGDTNIDAEYAAKLKADCPSSGGDGNLAQLDVSTPNFFDNDYYKNLLKQEGLLHSDQVLHDGGSTDSLVGSYSSSKSKFFGDFGAAMINMGNISPLTGSSGEVRNNCRKVNS